MRMGENDKWKPPPISRYKMNIGLHVINGQRDVGVGLLIRNSQGLVIAAQSMKIHEGSDSVQRHAWAVLHAIQFAFVIGIRCVEMELGCYELVDLLQSNGPCLAPIGNLVDDILAWKDSFEFLNFSLVQSDYIQ